VVEITGDLIIHSSGLHTVAALALFFNELVRIGGSLRIFDNNALLDLSWLPSLVKVGSDVQITGNSNLVWCSRFSDRTVVVSGIKWMPCLLWFEDKHVHV
jgi:hypothetical protein